MRQHRENIHKIILEHGWMVHGVFRTAPEDPPEFAYTIGLTDAGLPELLISGNMEPGLLMHLLNAAAKLHLADELVAGQDVEDIANVVFKVRACGPDAPVQQARNYYGDPHGMLGKVQVLQLIWPDERGVYPGSFLWAEENRQPLY